MTDEYITIKPNRKMDYLRYFLILAGIIMFTLAMVKIGYVKGIDRGISYGYNMGASDIIKTAIQNGTIPVPVNNSGQLGFENVRIIGYDTCMDYIKFAENRTKWKQEKNK